jgi:hypothetical protein
VLFSGEKFGKKEPYLSQEYLFLRIFATFQLIRCQVLAEIADSEFSSTRSFIYQGLFFLCLLRHAFGLR